MMESKKSGVDVTIVEEVMMKKLRVQNLGAYICSGVGTKKGVDLQIAINRDGPWTLWIHLNRLGLSVQIAR